MKKVKILALCLLTLALVFALASCSGEKPPVGPDATQTPDVTGTPDGPVDELTKIENLKVNGTPISEYKIVTVGVKYGTKYAAELLQKKILALTGHELEITSSSASAAFYLDSKDANDGMYHIESDGTSITLYGTGLSGAYTAANAMLEMIGRNEDATVVDDSAPMLLLNNVKKKLEDGALSIGYMGDSIKEAYGYSSYTINITEHFKELYPDADIKMINHSMGGKNTTWGLYTMDEAVLGAGYDDLIFISLGPNDAPYGNDYTQLALNYQSMIDKIYKNDPETQIVFVTHGRKSEMRDTLAGYRYDFIAAMLDVATYYEIPVIDVIYTFGDIWNNDETVWRYYIYDTAHPNQNGQDLYGEIVWKTLEVALENSDSEAYESIYMPDEPLYKNSKVNAVEIPWDEVKDEIRFGTGDEAGWNAKGRTAKIGSTLYYDFEGYGIELGIGKNDAAPCMILAQIYNENGELVFEEEKDAEHRYNLFITNALEFGKYTLKLTITGPSKRYPSDFPSLTVTSVMVIK